MKIFVCDICGNKIKTTVNMVRLIIRSYCEELDFMKEEICKECEDKIKDFINGLKK